MNSGFKNLIEMLKTFPDDMACRKHLEKVRWNNGAFCPFCGGMRIYHFKDGIHHKCADCRKRFTITVGTIFEDTHIGLHKWFVAIYMITNHSKGISSLQLSKDLGVTQKTAWFMMHRLRMATATAAFNAPLSGIVEMDESYIGGKEKNKHMSKRIAHAQGRSYKGKTPVVALVERNGRVKSFKAIDAHSQTLRSIIVDHICIGTTICTDEWPSYRGLEPFYIHEPVCHGSGQYVSGKAHTNTVENFFSIFKRGIIGIYHQISPKHLTRYLDEFTFRYNHIGVRTQSFDTILSKCNGRLTYKGLIA